MRIVIIFYFSFMLNYLFSQNNKKLEEMSFEITISYKITSPLCIQQPNLIRLLTIGLQYTWTDTLGRKQMNFISRNNLDLVTLKRIRKELKKIKIERMCIENFKKNFVVIYNQDKKDFFRIPFSHIPYMQIKLSNRKSKEVYLYMCFLCEKKSKRLVNYIIELIPAEHKIYFQEYCK